MQITKSQIKKLAGRLEANFPEIHFAYLFGSVNKGKSLRYSDIDVALYLKPASKTAELIAGIIGTVEDTMPGHHCDLTILNDAGEFIAMEALKGKILFIREYSRDLHAEFYSLSCRMYEDKYAWMKKQLKYRGHEVQWDH